MISVQTDHRSVICTDDTYEVQYTQCNTFNKDQSDQVAILSGLPSEKNSLYCHTFEFQ